MGKYWLMIGFNFTITNALELYTRMFANFPAFPMLAITALIFIIVITLNLDNNNTHFLYYGLNIILIGIICWTHGMNILNNIDSFWGVNLFKNVYFYLANMVLALLLISLILRNRKFDKGIKYITIVFYYLILVNLLLMLYISNYLQNIMVLVVSNTYPMIYFGNMIAFVMYIALILYWLFFKKKIKKHRLGNHL